MFFPLHKMLHNRIILYCYKCLFRLMLVLFFYYYLIVKPIEHINNNLTMPKKAGYMTMQQRKFLEFLTDNKLNSNLIKVAPTKMISKIEQKHFKFIQAVCNKKLMINASPLKFMICETRGRFQQPVYLISQLRNKLYEEKLRDALCRDALIRVFYAKQQNQRNEFSSDLFDNDYIDFAQRIEIKPYTAIDAKDWELGIHDLLDKFDELRRIEIIQYESKDANDSIMFSIIRHGIPQYLLHLNECNNVALQYVIRRFIFNMYYPFSIIREHSGEKQECFISFIQKFSFNNYSFSGTRNIQLNKALL